MRLLPPVSMFYKQSSVFYGDIILVAHNDSLMFTPSRTHLKLNVSTLEGLNQNKSSLRLYKTFCLLVLISSVLNHRNARFELACNAGLG